MKFEHVTKAYCYIYATGGHLQDSLINWKLPTWPPFGSVAVEPPLTSWPTYWVLLFHCFYVIYNFAICVPTWTKACLHCLQKKQFCVCNLNG